MGMLPPEGPRSDEGLRRIAEGDQRRIVRGLKSSSWVIPIAALILALIVVATAVRILFLG